MTSVALSKEWFSAAELAESGLPGLPTTSRGVTSWARKSGVHDTEDKVRDRAGKGGGREYHYSALPLPAQRQLLAEVIETTAEQEARGALWAAYDALPETGRKTAADRLKILDAVDLLERHGMRRTLAVKQVAGEFGKGARTLFDWLKMVDGVDRADWLAALAPRKRGPSVAIVDVADGDSFMHYFKSLALRLGEPTFRDCHRDATRLANNKGLEVIPYERALRWFHRDVPKVVQVFKREGWQALQRKFPAQIRDKSGLHAMEGVNADVHKIDVFVRWPDGLVNRPQICAFQDLYSGKILSWRVDHTPNKCMVIAAFGDMVNRYGVPRECTFDNGMEFANKHMTGGAQHRFRYKLREDEAPGILMLFGIKLHFATPAHGQAKPIERSFKDWASTIAKDVRFDGAYVGNKPDAKPENYGSRAIPFDEFMAVLDERVAEMNARPGRQSAAAKGRSFDETFVASIEAGAPIVKATEEQRRLWLMGHREVKVPKQQVSVTLHKNEYYAPWLVQHMGQTLVARFDPADLHAGLWMEDKKGQPLGFLECRQAVGFFDEAGARAAGKQRRDIRKAVKALEEAQNLTPVKDLARMMTEATPDPVPTEDIDARVVALPTRAHQMPKAVPQAPAQSATVDRDAFQAKRAERAARKAEEQRSATAETPRDMFFRARRILDDIAAGRSVGASERDWAESYTQTAEFRSKTRLFEKFGAEGVR